MKEIQDHYFQKAKQQGFLARSVFKLEEIDQKYHLLKPHQKVLDLGASPGSWLQYTCKKIGPTGRALAIDLKPLGFKPPTNVLFQQVSVVAFQGLLEDGEWIKFDLVLSDMAPNTSGIRVKDAFDSYNLSEMSFKVALRELKLGGSFLTKTLQGPMTPELHKNMALHFAEVHLVKPKSSRSESTEIFLLGKRFRQNLSLAD